MARKKIIKDGFHLKYIPSGRLSELKKIAKAFPHIEDKNIALFKFIETWSSILERSRKSDSGYVSVNVATLKKTLKLDNGTSQILNDLVKYKFLKRNKSGFKIGVQSWTYKPLYEKLQLMVINRNSLSITTDDMLSNQINNLKGGFTSLL